MSYWSQSQILHLPSPYVPVVGVPLYSDRLKTYASRLVQCVMVMVSVLLSSVCREVITTFPPAHKEPEQAWRDRGS